LVLDLKTIANNKTEIKIYSELVFLKNCAAIKQKIEEFYNSNLTYLIDEIFLPTLVAKFKNEESPSQKLLNLASQKL
jgi:predicted DNA-binding transcriptional regulator